MRKKAEYGPLDGVWSDVLWNPEHGFLQNSFRLVEMGILSLPIGSMGWFKVGLMAAGAIGISLENFGRYLDEALGIKTSEDLQKVVNQPKNTKKTIDQMMKEKNGLGKGSFLSRHMLIKNAAGYYRNRGYSHTPDFEHSSPRRGTPPHNMTKTEKENFIRTEKIRQSQHEQSLKQYIETATAEYESLKPDLAEAKRDLDRILNLLSAATTPQEKTQYESMRKEKQEKVSGIDDEMRRLNRSLISAKTTLKHHHNPESRKQYFDQIDSVKALPDPPGTGKASRIMRSLLGDSADDGAGKLILRFLTWFAGSMIYMKARDMEKKILSGSAINKNPQEQDTDQPAQPDEQNSTSPKKYDSLFK